MTPTCGGNIADIETVDKNTGVQSQVYNAVLHNTYKTQYKASIFRAMKAQINSALLNTVWT